MWLGSTDGPDVPEIGDLAVDRNLIWYCSSRQGLNVIDVSDPLNTEWLGQHRLTSPVDGTSVYDCAHVVVDPIGNRVFVTHSRTSLADAAFVTAIDVADPANPFELWTVSYDGQIDGIAHAGDALLLAAHEEGVILQAFDDVGPAYQHRVIETEDAWQVQARGPIAFVADGTGLAAINLAHPDGPTVFDRVDLPGAVKDLHVEDDIAYVACGAEGIAVVDVADPSAMVVIQQVDTPGTAVAVDVNDDAVFVADWNALYMFDRTDPLNLVQRGHEPVQPVDDAPVDSRVFAVATDGDLVFGGGWSELDLYAYQADVEAPDLVIGPSVLQLGVVGAGEQTEQLIQLENQGDAHLSLFDVVASPADVLAIDGDLPDSLAAGASAFLRVTLSSISDDPFAGWVLAASDDPDQPRQCTPISANTEGISVGDTVDDFSFTDLQGTVHTLEEQRGKVALLAYFATF